MIASVASNFFSRCLNFVHFSSGTAVKSSLKGGEGLRRPSLSPFFGQTPFHRALSAGLKTCELHLARFGLVIGGGVA